MRFEWDEKKNHSNTTKHGISFEGAVDCFVDPFCLTILDRHVGGEQRLWTIGRLRNLVVVGVVHTYQTLHGDEITRIISARRTTPAERRFYEEADI